MTSGLSMLKLPQKLMKFASKVVTLKDIVANFVAMLCPIAIDDSWLF